ncbi:hypothetical protein AB0A77_17430 [Streptomyces varsoviensis]
MSVSRFCRIIGISRNSYQKWRITAHEE